jgi:predicted ester cyclase
MFLKARQETDHEHNIACTPCPRVCRGSQHQERGPVRYVRRTRLVNHNPFVAPGLTGVKAFFTGWLAAFPDTHVVVEDSLTSGDTLVGRFTYTATHTGPFLGIAGTGNRIIMRSIDIWRVREGKFIEHWDELNLLEVFQQLGVIPRFAP